MQIAIVSHQTKLSDADLAFAAEACNKQVIACAEAWDIDPTPVVFYATAEGLPQSHCRIMDVVDDLDQPGARGYHTNDLGIVYGRVLAQSLDDTTVTLSHECLEELVDPGCDQWRSMGDGMMAALEVCDPVEGDTYPIAATLFEETRQVLVSNYVLPRWFEPALLGAFDALLKLSAPYLMTEGGYMVVRDVAGRESDVYARPRVRVATAAGGARAAAKIMNAGSRLMRRLRA